MPSAGPLIVFDKVSVKYNEYVTGLEEITLDIQQGEFVFLCGQTGSGKSTLLKVLTRQVPVSSGRVTLAGQELSTLQPQDIPALRRHIGFVPQDFGLLPTKKVWENVAYAMRAIGRSKDEVRKEVPAILEQVNILHRADAFPNQLSGGEQQRVAIARALINDPPLLLADEPTGNLDPTHSREIIDILLRLNAKGTTVLVATHDMLVVERVGKRIVNMIAGHIEGQLPDHDDFDHEESELQLTEGDHV